MDANSSSGTDKGDLTDWLILRFKQLISEGTLTPGYKLPSERELSVHFGVSRTSLRPVMKILKMMGVVSQRVGDGTYLNGDASSVLAEPMEFLFLLDETSSQELVETRLMVEPTLAAKAAELASREQILVLRQTIAEIEAAGTDQFRIAFHQAIFQAIQRHDGPEAERHMRDHLIDARALLLQARQSEADERLRKSIGKNTARKRSAVKATR